MLNRRFTDAYLTLQDSLGKLILPIESLVTDISPYLHKFDPCLKSYGLIFSVQQNLEPTE